MINKLIQIVTSIIGIMSIVVIFWLIVQLVFSFDPGNRYEPLPHRYALIIVSHPSIIVLMLISAYYTIERGFSVSMRHLGLSK